MARQIKPYTMCSETSVTCPICRGGTRGLVTPEVLTRQACVAGVEVFSFLKGASSNAGDLDEKLLEPMKLFCEHNGCNERFPRSAAGVKSFVIHTLTCPHRQDQGTACSHTVKMEGGVELKTIEEAIRAWSNTHEHHNHNCPEISKRQLDRIATQLERVRSMWSTLSDVEKRRATDYIAAGSFDVLDSLLRLHARRASMTEEERRWEDEQQREIDLSLPRNHFQDEEVIDLSGDEP